GELRLRAGLRRPRPLDHVLPARGRERSRELPRRLVLLRVGDLRRRHRGLRLSGTPGALLPPLTRAPRRAASPGGPRPPYSRSCSASALASAKAESASARRPSWASRFASSTWRRGSSAATASA